MIRLDNQTAKVQFVLGGAVAANALTAYASWYDIPPDRKVSYEEYRGSKAHKSSNNTTDVDLVPAPTVPGVVRMVDYIGIHNADTGAITVIVKIDDSAASPVEAILLRKSLSANETAIWSRQAGWQVL